MPRPPAKDPFAFDRAKINRGQKSVMSPVLKILLGVVGGLFLICAGIFGYAFLQGVNEGIQRGQERARNAPPGSSAGEAAFRAANMQITSRASDGTSTWGNTEEARRLAADFSTKIRALREVYFTKRKKEPVVSLSDGEFLTYCHLDDRACVFLVHVPDLRKFTPQAKAGLADLAWATAQQVVRSNLKDPPPRMAIGTRGVMLYGHALVGTFQPDEESDDDGVEVRESGDKPESLLYQFFSPSPVPQTSPSAAQAAAADMPDEDEADAKPAQAESPEDHTAAGATDDQLEAAKSPDDVAVPRAPESQLETVKPPDDKPAPSVKRKERALTKKAGPSSKHETRMAEAKKRSDERAAASKLRMAESFRRVGDLATFRKRLQEIVDKYPATEAGQKAAEFLE